MLEARPGAHHPRERAVLRHRDEKVERLRAEEAIRKRTERSRHIGIAHDARHVAVVLLPPASATNTYKSRPSLALNTRIGNSDTLGCVGECVHVRVFLFFFPFLAPRRKHKTAGTLRKTRHRSLPSPVCIYAAVPPDVAPRDASVGDAGSRSDHARRAAAAAARPVRRRAEGRGFPVPILAGPAGPAIPPHGIKELVQSPDARPRGVEHCKDDHRGQQELERSRHFLVAFFGDD